MIDNSKLTKNKWYRITDDDNKIYKMQFIGMKKLFGTFLYVFRSPSEIAYIGKDCIVKIESYKKITPDEQAREMGCLDEYKMYMTANDKKLGNKYIYKTIFNKNS